MGDIFAKMQPGRRLSLWRRLAARNPMFRPAITAALVVLAIDQLSKNWVYYFSPIGGKLCTPRTEQFCGHLELSDIFDLTMVWNQGVSFGLFSGGMISRVGLSLLASAVAIALLSWLARLRRPVAAIGVGLIIGGAFGNVIDRVIYGAVIDFLDFSGVYHPWFEIQGNFPFIRFGMYPFRWVFNVADVGVNLGIACLAWDALFGQRNKSSAT